MNTITLIVTLEQKHEMLVSVAKELKRVVESYNYIKNMTDEEIADLHKKYKIEIPLEIYNKNKIKKRIETLKEIRKILE